jgi:hypothetical protein
MDAPLCQLDGSLCPIKSFPGTFLRLTRLPHPEQELAMRSKRCAAFLLLAGGLLVSPAWGRIKLITLPVRQRVEIQLDNPHATLVEEERIVPLVKGHNEVDFSWANTSIDPNTILFRVIDKPEQVKVLSVSYPPNEQSLVWAVSSTDSGSARVRISYLLGNLSKSFNYRAIANHAETSLVLSQYIRIDNLANEDFASTEMWAGFGKQFHKPIGLNETKEMLMAKFEGVPVRKTYTCDVTEFGYLDEAQKKLRVPMHYVIKNDKKSALGQSALPEGKVRIFIEAGAAGKQDQPTAFLGEDWGKFTPTDSEMRLYLGVAQDIVVKRFIEKNQTHRIAGNPASLYDKEVVVKYEIENRKDQPVTLDISENLKNLRNEAVGGDTHRDVQWELGKQTDLGTADPEKSDFEKLVFHVDLPARAKDGTAQKVVKHLNVVFKNEW